MSSMSHGHPGDNWWRWQHHYPCLGEQEYRNMLGKSGRPPDLNISKRPLISKGKWSMSLLHSLRVSATENPSSWKNGKNSSPKHHRQSSTWHMESLWQGILARREVPPGNPSQLGHTGINCLNYWGYQFFQHLQRFLQKTIKVGGVPYHLN